MGIAILLLLHCQPLAGRQGGHVHCGVGEHGASV